MATTKKSGRAAASKKATKNGTTGKATAAKVPKATARGKAPVNGQGLREADPHKWVAAEGFTSTAEVELPELLIDEVIGQDEAVAVAKKAARQGRHLLLLGDPGTGKSMIAKAMAQILPPTHNDDVMVWPNIKDGNQPRVEVTKGGEGRKKFLENNQIAKRRHRWFTIFEWSVAALLLGVGLASFFVFGGTSGIMVGLFCMLVAIFFLFVTRQTKLKSTQQVPNLLIERADAAAAAPYIDATGSHDGALLGDIRHDPFQSGGMETPTHLRVEPGAIHRANKGVLFIDEINVLRLKSQQALLTAMQEKKYAITGQSEKSSGAMARTDPVPCDFILVAAGNMDVLTGTDSRYTGLHPALRSRIRGYGYEVYVRSVMEDTDENRMKLVRFVAQEVRRDGQIPHFDQAAVAEVIREAQRRSGHSGKLTLRLRELGGLVRTAGDVARDESRDLVTVDDVLTAKRMSQSLEYQVTRRGIEVTTAHEALQVTGTAVGMATGAAYMGTGETGEPAGIVVPVEADATVSSDRQKGGLFLGGGVDKPTIRDSVSAVLKRLRGSDMSGIDVHVQAMLQSPGAETRALAAATAVAAISALEDLPVHRNTVLLGELSVTGRMRPVDGITQMIEGASDLGYTRAVVPKANQLDVLLEHRYRGKIEVVFVDTLSEALFYALDTTPKRLQMVRTSLTKRR